MLIFDKYIAKSTVKNVSFWIMVVCFTLLGIISNYLRHGLNIPGRVFQAMGIFLMLWIISKSYELWQVNFVPKNLIGNIYTEFYNGEDKACWKIIGISKNRAWMECIQIESLSKGCPNVGANESWSLKAIRWREPYTAHLEKAT